MVVQYPDRRDDDQYLGKEIETKMDGIASAAGKLLLLVFVVGPIVFFAIGYVTEATKDSPEASLALIGGLLLLVFIGGIYISRSMRN